METLIKKMLYIARNMASQNFEYMKQQGYGRMGMGQFWESIPINVTPRKIKG